jgi:signal transduction histidine kinase/ActR/RegA family two-component response regulator
LRKSFAGGLEDCRSSKGYQSRVWTDTLLGAWVETSFMIHDSQAKPVRYARALAEIFSPWAIWGALTVALGIAYFLAAELSLALILETDGVAVFWPAAGIAAGALISIGSAARFPVIVGVMAANILANLLGDRNIWSSIVFAACNAGEAVLVAGLIERFFGSPFSLDRLHRVLGLFVGAIVGTAVSGIGGTLGYVLFHSSTTSALTIWYHWFSSDAIGIITVAPLLIALGSALRGLPPREGFLEGACALVLVTTFSALFLYLPSVPWADNVIIALMFPVFLWIGARYGPILTAVAISISSFAILWAATFGIGIFDSSVLLLVDRVRSAQVDIMIFSFSGLILAALFSERRQHEAKLEESEEQLRDALSTAERADRAKSSFLAAASHDLRQPLQTLKFLQGALQRQPQNSEAQAALIGIDRSLKSMDGMLSALLDINRLETGALRASMSDFEVKDIFDSVAADFADLINEKGLKWRLVKSAVTIHSDRRLLEVMIRNLVSNAVRFTDQGKVLLGCRRARDKVRIEVWDSGVGIMGDQIPLIFEEYYQAAEGARLAGFGLGLAIVQRVGKILNHRIDVHSTPGKGSGFFIEVPLGREQANVTHRFKMTRGQIVGPLPRTILIIEDEGFVRTGLELLFSSEGIACVSVATGNEALALVTEKGLRPDLVVSDYNLPGMNGVESIEILRAAVAWKIPAIVLTGEIRSDVIEAIAQHDLSIATKPIEADELLQLVQGLHANASERAAFGQRAPA